MQVSLQQHLKEVAELYCLLYNSWHNVLAWSSESVNYENKTSVARLQNWKEIGFFPISTKVRNVFRQTSKLALPLPNSYLFMSI